MKILFDIPNLASHFIREKKNFPLFEEEEIQSAEFGEKRKIDFASGRYCARKALQQLEHPSCPIQIGPKREPIWPKDFIGSISHTHNLCGAIAGKMEHFHGLGLDVENMERFHLGLLKSVCTDNELQKMSAFEPSTQLNSLATIFTLKEAFYKYQYPITQTYLGFKDVEIDFRFEKVYFKSLHEKVQVLLEDMLIEALFFEQEKHIIGLVYAAKL